MKPVTSDFYRARCIKCNIEFVAELGCLKRHLNSKYHVNATRATPRSSAVFMSKFAAFEPTIDTQVKTAEIKLAAFIAEHNISFSATDHLNDLLKEIFRLEYCKKSVDQTYKNHFDYTECYW